MSRAGWCDARGLSTVEYVVILVTIVLVGLLAWRAFGEQPSARAAESAVAVQRMEGRGQAAAPASRRDEQPHAGTSSNTAPPRAAAALTVPATASRTHAGERSPQHGVIGAVSAPTTVAFRGFREEAGQTSSGPNGFRVERTETPNWRGPSHVEAGTGALTAEARLYRDALDALSPTMLGRAVRDLRDMAFSDDSLIDAVDAREDDLRDRAVIAGYNVVLEGGRAMVRGAFETHDLALDVLLDSGAGDRAVGALREAVHNPRDTWARTSDAVRQKSDEISRAAANTWNACRSGQAGTCVTGLGAPAVALAKLLPSVIGGVRGLLKLRGAARDAAEHVPTPHVPPNSAPHLQSQPTSVDVPDVPADTSHLHAANDPHVMHPQPLVRAANGPPVDAVAPEGPRLTLITGGRADVPRAQSSGSSGQGNGANVVSPGGSSSSSAGAAPSASGGSSSPGPTYLGEGTDMVVTRRGDQVFKEVRREVGNPEDARWRLDDDQRDTLAKGTVYYTNRLRRDPRLARVIPETWDAGPAQIGQRHVGGLTIAELRQRDPRAALRAMEQAQELVEHARRTLGMPDGQNQVIGSGWSLHLDPRLSNFRVDENGRVIGWIDPTSLVPPDSSLIR